MRSYYTNGSGSMLEEKVAARNLNDSGCTVAEYLVYSIEQAATKLPDQEAVKKTLKDHMEKCAQTATIFSEKPLVEAIFLNSSGDQTKLAEALSKHYAFSSPYAMTESAKLAVSVEKTKPTSLPMQIVLSTALDEKKEVNDTQDGYTLKIISQQDYATVTFSGDKVDHLEVKQTYITTIEEAQAKFHCRVDPDSFARSLTMPQGKQLHGNRLKCDSIAISALDESFNAHNPEGVVFRPDDFHVLIVGGLAKFVQLYPDAFRGSFGNFKGVKIIQIRDPAELYEGCPPQNWDEVPEALSKRTREEIPEAIGDLLTMPFSTSTKLDMQVKHALLLGTVSSYFNYRVDSRCMIRKFTLEGTVEDYKHLYEMADKLIDALKLPPVKDGEKTIEVLKLARRWLERLRDNFLSKLYEARRAVKADVSFFLDFYKFHSGSGNDWVTGKIVFCFPFLISKSSSRYFINSFILGSRIELSGEKGPCPTELPANITNVYISWYSKKSKVEYRMLLKAGMFASTIDRQGRFGIHTDWTLSYVDGAPGVRARWGAESAHNEAKAQRPKKPIEFVDAKLQGTAQSLDLKLYEWKRVTDKVTEIKKYLDNSAVDQARRTLFNEMKIDDFIKACEKVRTREQFVAYMSTALTAMVDRLSETGGKTFHRHLVGEEKSWLGSPAKNGLIDHIKYVRHLVICSDVSLKQRHMHGLLTPDELVSYKEREGVIVDSAPLRLASP